MSPVLIMLFLAAAVGIGVYASVVPQGDRRWWFCAAVVVTLAVVSRLVDHGVIATVLADLAELSAVGLVWCGGTPKARAAARVYLIAVVLGVAFAGAAEALIDTAPTGYTAQLAVFLLILGFALKLGLVPVYFWLPAVARASSAMTTALIIAVVDVGSFADLMALREEAPWVFQNFAGLWIAVAMLSLLGAALLALAQTELKAMLAFSSIDDIGYLLLGLVLGGADGMAGAWYGLLGHGLAKIVLFGAVGAAEYVIGQPVTLQTRGLAARVPVASACFMLGALGFIGVPPTLGFIGHWRLYLAGAELGGPILLAAMYAASAMGLLCYVRAIHRTWLGPTNLADTGKSLPLPAAAVLLIFAIGPVLLGLQPGLVRRTAEAAHHAQADRSDSSVSLATAELGRKQR